MQVRLLRHNKRKSTQNWFVRGEARQRCTPREKGCRRPPQEEERCKERLSHVYRSFLRVFTFSQLSGFFSTPDPP